MKTKFKSQRKGAVLATVTVVSVMMVVIVMAATQLVSHTNSKTNEEYRKKQAYYVAASCCRAFVAETTGFTCLATEDDSVIQEKIAQLEAIAGEDPVKVEITSDAHAGDEVGKSQPRWNNAECELKVEKIGGKGLKVVSTATYLGQTKTVVAYLNIDTLRMHKFTPKALEIIGTDGGIKTQFENIQVYGATGATSMDSHDMNTVYQFNHNENKLYGETDINGSMSVQNNNRFYSNPYYYPGKDEAKGCVVNVSRSMVFIANTPTFSPNQGKSLTDMTINPREIGSDYNFLNVRQGLIICSDNAMIGTDDDYSVDAHAGMIYFGKAAGIGDALRTACARKNDADTSVDVDGYWDKIKGTISSFGNANGNTIHGNVFTHKVSGDGENMFNGDLFVNDVKANVTGDIYLDGDLYVCGSDPHLTDNTVHLLKGHYAYNCARTYNPDGSVATPDVSARVTSLPGVGNIDFSDELSWTSIPRAQQPEFPLLSETPYYYFPEHLLCQEGVSTIKDKYEAMYKPGTDDLDTDHVPSITDDRFKNKDDSGNYIEVYGDKTGSGPVFRPDYVVTEDCYIDYLDNDNILIDVDKAKDDIVVVLKNGGHCSNNNVILVNNPTDPEVPGEAKFVYFVSDSGVGTTYNEYATSTAKPKPVSTYDHSTFNSNPQFSFSGAHNVVMDLESFFNSDVYNNGDKVRCSGGTLNPTPDKDKDGYKLHSNNIFFLLTEGSELFCDEANTILQACVYMPKATYRTSNHGRSIKISPDFATTDMESVAIIGNLVCEHYEVEKGNRNAIVYLPFSPCSMLSIIKGTGEEHATSSYMLDHYEAS